MTSNGDIRTRCLRPGGRGSKTACLRQSEVNFGAFAGFINRQFDTLCLDKIVNDPQALTRYSIRDIVEGAGAQGMELLNWVAARGALTSKMSEVHRNYHIPVSNTAAATRLGDPLRCV